MDKFKEQDSFLIIKVTQCLLMIIIQKLPITEKRNKIQ